MSLHDRIQFRNATIADLELLRYWDSLPFLIETGDDDWEWETELLKKPDWREQLIAELDGEPLGFVQIIDAHLEESHYWGDCEPHTMAIDIWIGDESKLGKGYGRVMMTIAIEKCFAYPEVKYILIDPLETNKRAHSFYEHMGFEFLEKRIFEEDHCLVYKLTRQKWESHSPTLSQ